MTDRSWWRPARGCSSSRERAAAGASRRAAFLGDAGDAALSRSARRRAVRRARPRPLRRQAAPLQRRRRDLGGDRGAPAYPEGPRRRETAAGTAVARARLIWALEAGGPTSRAAVGGTIPGGLFRSRRPRRDAGSWSRRCGTGPSASSGSAAATTTPGIHSICVDPRDATTRRGRRLVRRRVAHQRRRRDLGAARANGMRAEYMPPEQSATTRTSRTRTAWCSARRSPTCCGCSTTTASSASTDGARARGTRSSDVPPSTFGFAVAVHPRDPDTAWFVPAIKDESRIPVDGKVVVTRTRDGGESFEVLSRRACRRSTPTTWSTATASTSTPSGERLAMGSTTGGLWAQRKSGRYLAYPTRASATDLRRPLSREIRRETLDVEGTA